MIFVMKEVRLRAWWFCYIIMYHHSLSRLIEAYYAHNLNNSNQFKQFEYNLIYNDSVRQISSSYLLLAIMTESYQKSKKLTHIIPFFKVRCIGEDEDASLVA